jgi:serine/threonine protein kinase
MIRDRRQRHHRAPPAGAIAFQSRAGEAGVAFTDEFPTAELVPHQPYVQTHLALDDDHTDPWPVRAAADAAYAQHRPDDAGADTPGPPIPDIAAGGVLGGRYLLDSIIGQGGNSSVFLARDLRRASEERGAKNLVAVKVLHPAQRSNPHALIRLKREYRQMQSLLHPGIVQVLDLDCDGDVWFLTMELVAGETASTWMRKSVSHADAMKVIRGCCTALDHAHSRGILHGDLKPSNVLVLRDGAIKLIDFGSAPASSDRAVVGSHASVGVTSRYASREVLMGEGIEQRDDVFSLACLCYAILSGGGHPFDRKTALEAAQTHMAPVHVSSIPERLFEVIARGLAMERASRPASVREFLHQLRRATKPMTSAIAPDPVAETTRRASVVSRLTFWQRLHAAIRFDGLTGRHYRRGLVALSVVVLGVCVPVRPSVEQAVVPRPEIPDEVPTVAAAAVGSAATSAPVQPAPLPKVEPDSQIAAEVPEIPDSPGMVTFDESTVVAGTSQPLVAITLRRLQSTQGPAEVQWRLESGSAQPDVDYERIRPQIVRFFEGQSVRTVFVPLIPADASVASFGSRTFTVALQKLPGGPALGPVARVAVTINAWAR